MASLRLPKDALVHRDDVEQRQLDASARKDQQQLLLLTRPVSAPIAIEHMVSSIRAALRSETERGHPLSPSTPGSYQRLSPLIEPLLVAYANSGATDWHRYALFNPLHYVRNLVDGDDDFELMVLCWGPGQRSRIHNHGHSHCWLTCLQAEVEEVRYSMPREQDRDDADKVQQPDEDGDPAVLHVRTPCPGLELQLAHNVPAGAVAYVNDQLFLHSVGCADGVPAPGAVTLHLYCPPIKRATLYEPQDDRVVVRKPGFFSVRGVRT